MYQNPMSRLPLGKFTPNPCVVLALLFLIPLTLFAPRFARAQEEVCANPDNPIVAENCQPGTDEWYIETVGNIEGFASAASANKGETIDFFVNTSAPQFDILIYRSGYYGGTGGRLVETVPDLTGQVQPACYRETNTGLTSCSNWSASYGLAIPQDWVSGVYIAKLVRQDDGGENYVLFVVRDDERDSDILLQQSTFSYQVYNNYGGKSAYNFNSGQCLTVSGAPRAVEVAMSRPVVGDMTNLGGNAFNTYFRPEYPMVRWLEMQGYDVTYTTNLETHRSGEADAHNELLDHRIFLVVGHDEYWTQEVRDAITAARDAGVHIGFFSANTGYWRVRLEPDPVTGEPDRVIAIYKTTESGPPDPTGHPTGTWRDPEGVNNPENELQGVQYIGDNTLLAFPLRITADRVVDPIYRNTGLQDMPPGSYINVGDRTLGWEWDGVVDNGQMPEGLVILAESPVFGELLLDSGRVYGTVQPITVHTTRYTAPSGAIVFASGTIQWSWGLGAHGAEQIVEPDRFIQQITYNLLADMGAQPTTPAAELILDGDDEVVTLDPNLFILEDATNPPVISNIQVNVTDTTATISWDTDTEANTQLWLGLNPDTITQPSYPITDYQLTHSIISEFLLPNTIYYYKVTSADVDGRFTISDTGSFQTETGSIMTRARATLRPAISAGRCWVEANTPLAVGIGAAGVMVVGFGGWRLTRRLRRRRGA
jgi:hypothetical protein